MPDVSIIVVSLGRPRSVEGDEASAAGAEAVYDSLSATIDKVIAVALTQTTVENASVGTPVALVTNFQLVILRIARLCRWRAPALSGPAQKLTAESNPAELHPRLIRRRLCDASQKTGVLIGV
jgi:hypothetical protein